MPKFRYAALNADGAKQTGVIVAPSSSSAKYELTNRRLTVQSLKERKKLSQIEITKVKVKPQEISNLSRQLSAFLKAGVPVLDAMQSISQETKSKQLKEILLDMATQLRAGDPFSDAVAAHAEHFPSYYPGIIRSAELSGRLDMVLEQLATYMDRDLRTRRRVKSALTYPMILAIMSLVTVVILIGFVLPKFKVFFQGFDAELPFTTKAMLATGDFMGSKGWMVGLGAVAFIALLVAFFKTERGKLTKDRMILKIPVIREVVRDAIIERFCRILSAMVGAGIPISSAMTAAIDSTDNRVFDAALVHSSEQMLQGRGLSAPIAETGLFPGTVTQMLRVGEETGTLDRQLEVAAEYYEKELSYKLERMTALFEPAVIVFMGGIVGFVAVALVQAMYGVYSQADLGGG